MAASGSTRSSAGSGNEGGRTARAGRTALEAEWAAGRAALDSSRADRLESLYGGFPLHPLFGGTP